MAKKREQGFAATLESYHAIMSDISAGNYSPTYLFMGAESYFIDKISEAILADALSEDDRDFNLDVVYGQDRSAAEIMELARTYPLMCPRRVVVVREASEIRDFAKLEAYFASPSAATVLVLCYKGKTVDKRSAVYKKALTSGVVFDSVAARDYEVKGFLTELVSRRGLSIDTKAKELILEHLGTDLTKIDNEVVKLLNALPVGSTQINCDHIERYIGISKEYNVFELTDALSLGDSAKVFRIVNNFILNPKNNPFVMVNTSLFRHFLALFRVGLIVNTAKRKGTPLPDKYTIVKEAGLSGVFLVDKYVSASRLFPAERCLRIIGYIREYDMKSKGIGASASMTDGDLLKELMLKIMSY